MTQQNSHSNVMRILITVLMAMWTSVALGLNPRCPSLVTRAAQEALSTRQSLIEKTELSAAQRNEYFNRLLDLTRSLSHGLPLTPAQQGVLGRFEASIPTDANAPTFLLLEHLFPLASSESQKLTLAMIYVNEYIKVAAGTRSLTAANQSNVEHELLSAASELMLECVCPLQHQLLPHSLPARQALKLIGNHHREFPGLDPLWEQIAPGRVMEVTEMTGDAITEKIEKTLHHNGAKPIVLSQHVTFNKNPYPESLYYKLSGWLATPVALQIRHLNQFKPVLGFSENGLWLKPGAEIRIVKTSAEVLPEGAPLRADFVYEDQKEKSLFYVVEFHAADAFWDSRLKIPVDILDFAQAKRFDAIQGATLYAYLSPSALEGRSLRESDAPLK